MYIGTGVSTKGPWVQCSSFWKGKPSKAYQFPHSSPAKIRQGPFHAAVAATFVLEAAHAEGARERAT